MSLTAPALGRPAPEPCRGERYRVPADLVKSPSFRHAINIAMDQSKFRLFGRIFWDEFTAPMRKVSPQLGSPAGGI
eukprot:gene8362-7670_t